MLIASPVIASGIADGATFNIIENKELGRIQAFFDAKPSEGVRRTLKEFGFRWSPASKAWHRILNTRGIEAALSFSRDVGAQSPTEPATPTVLAPFNGGPFALKEIENEPRVLDTDLGAALGMAQPLNIRKTVEANREELEGYGGFHAVRENPGSQGGRPSTTYWLNEPQALLLCMFARTPRAAEVRKMLIEAFMQWRHYRTGFQRMQTPKPDQTQRLELLEARIAKIEVAAALQLPPPVVQPAPASLMPWQSSETEKRVDAVFLKMIADYDAEGRIVSSRPSRNYAPSVFAADERSHGVTKRGFAVAMARLLIQGRIMATQYGPPSRRRWKVVPA